VSCAEPLPPAVVRDELGDSGRLSAMEPFPAAGHDSEPSHSQDRRSTVPTLTETVPEAEQAEA